MNKEKEFLQSVDSYKDLIKDEAADQPEDELFCECNFISKKLIENAARNMIYIDFEQLLSKLGAGTGCGSCLKNSSSREIYLKLSTKTE